MDRCREQTASQLHTEQKGASAAYRRTASQQGIPVKGVRLAGNDLCDVEGPFQTCPAVLRCVNAKSNQGASKFRVRTGSSNTRTVSRRSHIPVVSKGNRLSGGFSAQ